jgi:ABC-type dipeptide/oligopeptide/nickel transport system permease component
VDGFRAYLIRRIIHSIITVWIIATLIFLLFRAIPGDPTALIVDPTFPIEVREEMLRRFGLDRPVWEQYVAYMGNLLRGDMGISFFSRRPVTQEIGDRALNTLILALAAFFIAYPVGIVSGAVLATQRGKWLDSVGVTVALFFRAAPLFWTGMLAIMLFSFTLGWFPHAGMRSIGYEADNVFQKFLSTDFLRHLFLPAVVSGLYFMALPLLLLRNTMLEVLNEDFVEMARAKGIPERTVLFRHAVRNAILPVVTAAAVYIGLALGGITVIEVVFSWPGLGREIVQAVARRDFPVAQGAFLFLAVMISIMNLIADLAYGYLDPRITY